MKSQEKFVRPDSQYYIYSPSKAAPDMFLYPLQCGRFVYEAGYALRRESYDSYLIMYIQKGELKLEADDTEYHVTAGSFVLLNCYRRHAYSSSTGWESLWCHFDGVTAKAFCKNIHARLGTVFTLPDPYPALSRLASLYRTFQTGAVVREPLLSKYLNDILTEFLLCFPEGKASSGGIPRTEEIMTYISEHFSEDISVGDLAARAGLSQYHFIRTFKKDTGFTPYEYLLNTRIGAARYLLKNTGLSVKDICFQTGFAGESVFCSAFRQRMGMTPTQYREQE